MASPGLPTDITAGSTTGHAADHETAWGMLNEFDTDIGSAVTGQVLMRTSGGLWAAGNVASGTVTHPPVVVASVDAPDDVKANADFVCDGTADQAQINEAIKVAAAIPSLSGGPAEGESRGVVQLTGGRFYVSGACRFYSGVAVKGVGRMTDIRAVNNNDAGIFVLNDANVHHTLLADVVLNGDYASGGSCSGVYFDATGFDDLTGYPPAGSDHGPYFINVRCRNFLSGANRHGIYLTGTSGGPRSARIFLCGSGSRTGYGIAVNGASDSLITMCVVGGGGQDAFRVSGGNSRLVQCKAFYADGWGFDVSSSRCSLTGCESQDNVNGVRLSGQDVNVTGIVIDTSRDVGLEIATNGAVVQGLQMFNRGARFATQAVGLLLSSTPDNCIVTGRIGTADITTRVSGSWGNNNYARIVGGTIITEG